MPWILFLKPNPNLKIKSKACEVCQSTGQKELFTSTQLPISGFLCKSAAANNSSHEIRVHYCPICALLVLKKSDSQIDYKEVSRPTGRQLPAYAYEISDILSKKRKTGFLIEIGCNDGTFLDLLSQEGFSNLLGIEPSRILAEQVSKKGHEVFPAPLDLRSAMELVRRHGKAQNVVCRHTLEHVPEPLQFLRAIRELLAENGLACIEVPSARLIVDQLHVHEIWDEHLSYFLPENLTFALGRAGLAVENISVKAHLGMENIVIWARRSQGENPSLPDMSERVKACASFAKRWEEVREKMVEAVQASPRPLVVLGASHPQSNFLNFSGLSLWVDCAIDDDPAKVDHWLPLKGKNVPIVPSSRLKEVVAGGTLLLTAFGYPQWMEEASKAVAGHAKATLDLSQLTSAK